MVGCWDCKDRRECHRLVGCEKTPSSFGHRSPAHGSNHAEHMSRKQHRMNKRFNKRIKSK